MCHGGLEGTAVGGLLTQPRELDRTAPWVERLKRSMASKSSEDEVEALGAAMSQTFAELERRSQATVGMTPTPPPLTVKVKTRGVAQAPPDMHATPDDPSPGVDDDAQPRFAVDRRALKALKPLFFTPALSATPGDLPWTDFLHAMTSVGFLAEKMYGSAWQFTPTKLDVERSIQFHEPHPVAKLPYRVARRYGRRLHKTYGWHGGMFALLGTSA